MNLLHTLLYNILYNKYKKNPTKWSTSLNAQNSRKLIPNAGSKPQKRRWAPLLGSTSYKRALLTIMGDLSYAATNLQRISTSVYVLHNSSCDLLYYALKWWSLFYVLDIALSGVVRLPSPSVRNLVNTDRRWCRRISWCIVTVSWWRERLSTCARRRRSRIGRTLWRIPCTAGSHSLPPPTFSQSCNNRT